MAGAIRSRAAERDLLSIWRFIALDNTRAVDRFLLALVAQCERLGDAPGSGRARPELAAEVRSFPYRTYVIFYRTLPDGILILRVLHSSRDIDRVRWR